ncbi:MAG: hypothetical protein BGO99_03610 [Nitrosospira sp. 56-18]|nr:MAG: hypothetical protein BGO99_03610 [Nitrosospira sp. 56-18]
MAVGQDEVCGFRSAGGVQGKVLRRAMAIPFQGVATQASAEKSRNLPCSELTMPIDVEHCGKPLWIMVPNRKMSSQLRIRV